MVTGGCAQQKQENMNKGQSSHKVLIWNDKQSRSSVEMNDTNARPAIKGRKENIADYDVVFIGYPI